MKIAYSLYGKILTLFFRNIIHKYLQNMFFFSKRDPCLYDKHFFYKLLIILLTRMQP